MDESLKAFNELLLKFTPIRDKYDKIAEITGEKFNIFNVLKVDTNEVGTHSAILCELLSPHGSHGYKEEFLALFISKLEAKFNRPVHLLTNTAIVTIESHIGFINENNDEGGRIDILIKDSNHNAIIIENKIHAGDQYKQLIRYNKAYEKAPIFYLTLFGTEPSLESKGALIEGEHYACISYKEHIIPWLEECRKVAVNHPILRETITQYIILLKQLTHQTINDKMKKDIVELITKDSNNIEAAFGLVGTLEDVKQSIVEKFTEKLKSDLDSEKVSYSVDGEFGKKNVEFHINPKGWLSHHIELVFNKNYAELEIGIFRLDGKACSDNDFRTKVRNLLTDQSKGIRREDYENWVWFYQLSDWDNMSWGKKFDGEFNNNIKSLILETIHSLENINF